MEQQQNRYSKYKNGPKRFLQALLRLCIYGALLIAGEVSFYSITRLGKYIGQHIHFISYLFGYNWCVDERLNLSNIWNAAPESLYGQASLYMFFVYGLICVVGLEPAYRWMKKKEVPIVFRGIVYMFIILIMECSLGWVLKWLTGYDIWYYKDWGTCLKYTSFAIAPMWFICGLISEIVINVFDSFDNLKITLYNLAASESQTEEKHSGNKIAVISDVHIGRRDEVTKQGIGWFKGLYPGFLNIMLYKVAYDKRIQTLVLLGDFFDTWLCPPEAVPYKNVAEVINAWKKAPFMPALKKCMELCPNVMYIPGNHDMGVTQEDLDALSFGSNKIKLCTPGDYNSTEANPVRLFAENTSYTVNTIIHFEHGNACDLFNAPVSPSDTDTLQGLSFGYYVTRIMADADSYNIEKVFNKAYAAVADSNSLTDENKIGAEFIQLFVKALLDIANLKRDDENKLSEKSVIKMAAPYKDVTVGDVMNSYHSLLKKYEDSKKRSEETNQNDVPDQNNESQPQNYYIFAVGKKGLCRYARSQFGKKNVSKWFSRLFSNKPVDEVVVMGHTHYGMKEYVMNRERCGIYVNTGCVCSCGKQKMPSWVEIINTKHGCVVHLNKF